MSVRDQERQRILEMKPGFREMIDAVTYQIMGWKRSESWGGMNWVGEDGSYKADFATWDPTTNIAAAWEVVEKIKAMKFSIRHRFTTELTDLVRAEGQVIAWPAALFYLNPVHICKAALLAMME